MEKSTFDSSSGDQAGRLGGIISGVTGKETRFISSSFDVQIEGQNTVRHMDVTTHNHGNTMGAVYGSSTAPTTIKDEKTLCDYCKKPVHEFAKKRGTNNGDGQELRESIIADIADHRWYTGPNSLQAHHLICTEAMKGGDWGDITWEFGYSINHRNNGVILPYPMAVACQLHVPVHRSNHSKGTAGTLSYPDEIESYIKDILEDALAGEYCDNPQGLIDDMDEYSEFVLKQIDSFTWTITADGRDYKTGNNGCAGVSSITKKPNEPCPCNRVHGITRYEQQTLLIHDKKTLEIGT